MCDAAGSSRKFPPLFFSPGPVVYIAFKEAMVVMRSHFLRYTPALQLCFRCNLTCEAKGALAARLPLRSRSRFSFFRLPAFAHSWVCDGRSACAAILAGSVRPCSVLHQHTLRPLACFLGSILFPHQHASVPRFLARWRTTVCLSSGVWRFAVARARIDR